VSATVNANEGLTSDRATGASYSYDAGGRRESVVSGGQTTSYLYDGTTPI